MIADKNAAAKKSQLDKFKDAGLGKLVKGKPDSPYRLAEGD